MKLEWLRFAVLLVGVKARVAAPRPRRRTGHDQAPDYKELMSLMHGR